MAVRYRKNATAKRLKCALVNLNLTTRGMLLRYSWTKQLLTVPTLSCGMLVFMYVMAWRGSVKVGPLKQENIELPSGVSMQMVSQKPSTGSPQRR